MIEVKGNRNTIWFEGEKPQSGSSYDRLGAATVRSSGVTITGGRNESITNFGNGNEIITSNFNNTVTNYADYVTIMASDSENYVEDYGKYDIIEIDSNYNTIKSLGEHTTIKTYGGMNNIWNNLIFSYADFVSVGSITRTYWGSTRLVTSRFTTLSGGFASADIDDYAKETVIIHEAQDKGKKISGFDETSTLSIANSTFSTWQDQDDVLVLVGDNTITLEGAASLSTLNIEEIEFSNLSWHSTLTCDIERTFFNHLNCDIERNIMAGINFSSTDQAENTSGIQSIKIRIAEQQITDQVTFTGVIPLDIMQSIEGKYFDYEYKMKIESITQSGILYTYNCCSDADKLLYELLNFNIEKVSKWYDSSAATVPAESKEADYISAGEHIANLAETLGLDYSYQAHDFYSTVDPKTPGVSYFDLVRSVFGWSARIPTMLINVFIRGNKVYVIQRGEEENTVDISNEKISQPIFSREIVRTVWGQTPYNKTEVSTIPLVSTRLIYEGADKARFEPLKSDTRQDVDGVTTINYSYDSDGMLIKTEERSPSTVTITEHKYITGPSGNKILSEEHITVYSLSGEQIDYRSVKHSHTNYGQAAVTAGNSDSENIASMVKNVPFDERPTPYALGQHLKSIITESGGHKQWYRTISGLYAYDSSFPIIGPYLEVVSDAIEALNRNKKYTVTLSLFDYPHIIDFNDRIILNGEEYFLSSNEILTTPRISQQQNLTLVRYTP